MERFQYSQEVMEKRCEVVDHPCFEKVVKSCKNETNLFFGEHGGEDPWDKQVCTDNFYPWVEKVEEKKKCCGHFGKLAKCAKDLKCEKTLEKFMYITPDPRWPEGEIVECTCQEQWSENFG